MMRIISVSHALRLRHIDFLHKMPVEKGIINIKLVNSPLASECNVKHSMDGDEIYHRTESFMKINARLKAFSNKVSFILCNIVFGILFDAKLTFVGHYIMPQSQGN